VTLEGQRITGSPDRMVVCSRIIRPAWRTVRENIALAVNSVMKDLPLGERKGIGEHIDMVGTLGC